MMFSEGKTHSEIMVLKGEQARDQASWTLVNDGGTNVTGGDPRIFLLK
jgi:hypothetical protein